MRTDEFFDALGEIDEDMVAKAKSRVDDPIKVKVERVPWKPFAAAAACLAVAVIGIAVFIGVNARRDDIVKPDKSGSGSEISGYERAEFPENAKYQYNGDFSELELCPYAIVDRIYYHDFNELEKNSDFIVVGTFVDDARQDQPLVGNIYGSSFTRGMSFNKLRIDEVFKGDIGVGSEVVICDSYFVNNGRLMYTSGDSCTPMIKGEQWVYFLSKVSPEYGNYYYSVGAYDGRYSVPGNENTFVLTNNGLGVYDENEFRSGIYPDVKIMLGYPEGVEKLDFEDRTANYEFTMPDFVGETFVKRERDIYIAGTSRSLFAAAGIFDVYLADLNGDGKREIISECWNGLSGLSADYIVVYDNANSKQYILKRDPSEGSDIIDDRLEIRNGVLYAVRYDLLSSNNEFSAAPLKFEDLEEVTKSEPETIEYNGKTYLITNQTIYDGEVFMSIGQTKLEYQIGDFVEVLAMVHNYTDKPIKLEMPVQGENSHTEINVTIKQKDTELYEYFGDGVTRAFDDAIGYHIIEPGDTYYQEMRFDTCKQRYDTDNTIVPLLNPLGSYDGFAGIIWFSDGEPNRDQVGFSVDIVDRVGISEGRFTMDEFPNAEFSYNSVYLGAVENETVYDMFRYSSINSLYLADLNGDGKREICASVNYESEMGITDKRIFVYDFANKKLYELSDIGNYDYSIKSGETERDGKRRLWAAKCEYMTGFELSAEPLTLGILDEVEKSSESSKSVLKSVIMAAYRPLSSGRTYKFRMRELPDLYFICDENSVRVDYGNNFGFEIFEGAVETLYLADLNGDGKRELIAEYTGDYDVDGRLYKGSEIRVYDYANKKLYRKINDDYWSTLNYDNNTDTLTLHYNKFISDEPLTLDVLTEIK